MKELKYLFSFPFRKKINLGYLFSLTLSVLLALLVGALIMHLSGHDPAAGQGHAPGALSTARSRGDTLAKSAVLCLTGLRWRWAPRRASSTGARAIVPGRPGSAAVGDT